jgi:hypothetical protein
MKRIVAAQTRAGKFLKGETCAVRWLLRANSRHSQLWAFAR